MRAIARDLRAKSFGAFRESAPLTGGHAFPGRDDWHDGDYFRQRGDAWRVACRRFEYGQSDARSRIGRDLVRVKDVAPVQLFLNTSRCEDDFGNDPRRETKAQLRKIGGVGRAE